MVKKSQIDELEKHYTQENKVEEKSLTIYLQPSLDKMALYIPRWIAPNVLTMSAGLLISLVSILIVNHIPKLYGPVSPWVCLAGIVGTVGFVLLDNLDGRHAKNTGNSSKLGDFLDHGVDSFADPLSILVMAVIAQGGYSVPLWLFLVGMIMVCIINYIYLWSDRHTKICYVSDLQLEAYLFITLVFLLTAIFGVDIWIYNIRNMIPVDYLPSVIQSKVPDEIPFNVVLLCALILLPITEFYDTISRVLSVTKSTKPLLELIPPCVIAVGLAIWGIASPTKIFETQKLTTCMVTIVTFSLVTGRYNFARLSGDKITMNWENYLLLAICFVVALFKIDDAWLLPAFLVIMCLGTIHFYSKTVIDMARILNVPIFTTKKVAH